VSFVSAFSACLSLSPPVVPHPCSLFPLLHYLRIQSGSGPPFPASSPFSPLFTAFLELHPEVKFCAKWQGEEAILALEGLALSLWWQGCHTWPAGSVAWFVDGTSPRQQWGQRQMVLTWWRGRPPRSPAKRACARPVTPSPPASFIYLHLVSWR
jgi:hypothetical protein